MSISSIFFSIASCGIQRRGNGDLPVTVSGQICEETAKTVPPVMTETPETWAWTASR